MQPIYMQSNENFEVYTTVLSPQVTRGRCRYRHAADIKAEMMVVTRSYKPHWPDELELSQGDVILVLSKHEEERWFGRLQNGQQGYFPASYVVELSEEDHECEPAKDLRRSLARRSSAPACVSGVHGGHRLRRASRAGGGGVEGGQGEREGPILVLKPQTSLPHPQPQLQAQPQAYNSPSLFRRILSKHRRKSECHGAANRAFTTD